MLNSTHDVSQTVHSEICYIGLGSNLDSPIKQIQKAINAIANSVQIKLIKSSSLYKTPPMGPQNQNDYINAVVEIETTFSPLTLLDKLQAIELAQGRVRKQERWGARTLDLDLLLYGSKIINNDRLIVPHYGITQRSFVLYPLCEINSDIKLSKGQKLATFIPKLEKTNPVIEKLFISVENQGN